MNSQEINPPAIVRSVDSLSELLRHAKKVYASISTRDLLNKEEFIDLGRTLLKIKESCKAGEWTQRLEEIRVPRQRASEAMRACQLPPTVIDTCDSIRDLVKSLKPESEGDVCPAQDVPDNEGGQSEPGEEVATEAEDEIPNEPAKEKIICPDCKRKGKRSGCNECLQLRQGQSERGKSKAMSSREPEDNSNDDDAEAKQQKREAEQVDFDWKALRSTVSKLGQCYDRLAAALGIQGTPVVQEWHRRTKEVVQEMRAARCEIKRRKAREI